MFWCHKVTNPLLTSKYYLNVRLRHGIYIAILDVEGFPLEKQWNIVYPASKSLSILAQEFLQFLQEKGTNYIYLPDDHLKNMQ